jgi:hypothetical protein
MLRSQPKISCGYPLTMESGWRGGRAETWWSQHREASLNWLALGLLLAAWNASDNGVSTEARERPESLRGYSRVSVRAAAHHLEGRATPMR